jgi:hypothetical protein
VHGELPDDVSLYYSIEYRGRNDDAELSAIGITPRPASIGLPPLVVENRSASAPPTGYAEYPDERPPGPIEYSAPYAGVISVR